MIAIGRAVIVERKRILAGADVAAIDAAQAEGFQMPDQSAVAGTRLGKGPDAAKVRDQRQHRGPWRRVEISLAALEVGSLAHQPAPRVSDRTATALAFRFACHASQQRECSQAWPVGSVPYGSSWS